MTPNDTRDAVMTTAAIADHVAGIANAHLSADDVEAVRRLLLDNLLVSFWGSTRPCAKEIAQWSRRFAGTGPSQVLGGSWSTEPSVAALVHGTAAHSYELDDTHDETTSHPGCVIIPAALAVAAVTDATQGELFRAIAAGYEAMALVGCTAGGMDTVHRGFHPTPVFGSFGAATACLCLHAYRRGVAVAPEMLVAGWGHALSQACGSMQFSVEPTGGEVKRVHAGLGARNGVLAAEFALLPAVTAPLHSIEGAYGLSAIFGGPLRPVDMSGALQIHNISLKPYSCCRLFHSTIDALREITDGFTLPAARIDEITIRGPRLIAEQHMTRAASTMTAQYSCPYIVGATLTYGPERYDAYGEAHLSDRLIGALSEKVRFEISEELERKYYPKRFATGAALRLTDGTTRSAMVVDSVGTPRKPMSRDQILAKGAGLPAVENAFPPGEALIDRIWDDRTGSGILGALLVGGNPPH